MLDLDIATLYESETAMLHLAVIQNLKRFPADFMFQLTSTEKQGMQLPFINALQNTDLMLPQNRPLSQQEQYRDQSTYAFTVQGVMMLSNVINTKVAISMSIAIARAFVEISRMVSQPSDVKIYLQQLKQHLDSHDAHLNQIYDAMENLLDEKAAQRKWEGRERIGFK